MLDYLKNEANLTYTENGALAYESTNSHCLDLFATIGALRGASEWDMISRFIKAYAEDALTAMKILFFARDIRGGLGERRVFRVLINKLAKYEPETVRKNLSLIAEYGRFDDLLSLMHTPVEDDVMALIKTQLDEDLASDGEVSLLAKWLPSVNASNSGTVKLAKHIAAKLGMRDAEYRKMLTALRAKIRIIENNLRERDYTFDYSKQPSRAMFKYRAAFLRNDNEKYLDFLANVREGKAVLHTADLAPYDIINPCFKNVWEANTVSEEERLAMDVSWNALENFAGDENAIVVADGSGSMYWAENAKPIAVALSLAIYFAERNTGAFKNHFITFSAKPKLVEIKGKDIAEKVMYCSEFNEVANTNLDLVFDLILKAALKNKVPQSELPAKLYIVSDMQFDDCVENSDMTNFEHAKQKFAEHGYKLPSVVFWNVASRGSLQPVTQNEEGVALVSGCSARIFSMVAGGMANPYAVMMDIIGSERYAKVTV